MTRQHPAHRRPQHAAAAVVGTRGGQRGQHDAAQRAGQGRVHRRLFGDPVLGQQPRQRRHQHQAAANAQQAGKDADQRAQGKEGEQQGQHRGHGREPGGSKGSAARASRRRSDTLHQPFAIVGCARPPPGFCP